MSLIGWILGLKQEQLNKIPMNTPNKLYDAAKACIGKHITLNEAVPAMVGCAEAVSYVLTEIGVNDGPQGIASTASLDTWLRSDHRFLSINAPEEGAILVSPTGYGNGSIEGHTGVIAAFNTEFPNDWGIMSNDSPTGKFLERWCIARWALYYSKTGGLPMHYYRYIGT